MRDVLIQCDDCGHHCEVKMTFENSDSPEYIKNVVDTFTCHVIENLDCSWKWNSIGQPSLKD